VSIPKDIAAGEKLIVRVTSPKDPIFGELTDKKEITVK
jgi:hypothetical protein